MDKRCNSASNSTLDRSTFAFFLTTINFSYSSISAFSLRNFISSSAYLVLTLAARAFARFCVTRELKWDLFELREWHCETEVMPSREENAVKIVKTLMRKCVLDKIYSFLARLEWRNTASETIELSTAYILFERKTKSRLTLSTRNLQAKDSAVNLKNTSNYLLLPWHKENAEIACLRHWRFVHLESGKEKILVKSTKTRRI